MSRETLWHHRGVLGLCTRGFPGQCLGVIGCWESSSTSANVRAERETRVGMESGGSREGQELDNQNQLGEMTASPRKNKYLKTPDWMLPHATVLSCLHASTHFTFTTVKRVLKHYHSYFTQENTETQNKSLAQGHTAREWQSWHLKPAFPPLESALVMATLLMSEELTAWWVGLCGKRDGQMAGSAKYRVHWHTLSPALVGGEK